jgi:hypothetical protein
MKKLKVITEKSVALESPDHIFPVGTKNDNSTESNYISEVENYFDNKKINVMDIGCAGGQLAVDFYNRGHNSIGLEGSDYNIKHKQFNWTEYHEKVLWTADLTKPLKVVDENGNVIRLHQSVFPENFWKETILKDRIVEPYSFKNKVRICTNSFYMTMKRNTNV